MRKTIPSLKPMPAMAAAAMEAFVNGEAAPSQSTAPSAPVIAMAPPLSVAIAPQLEVEPAVAQAEVATLKTPEPKVRPSKTTAVPGAVERKDGTVRIRTVLYLTPETAARLKEHSFHNHIENSNVAEAAISAYLKRRE